MDSTSLHAVITGDVVGSSRMPDNIREVLPDLLFEAFDRTAEPLTRLYDDERWPVVMEFDAFRGDSWQMYVSEPLAAFRAALAFRAWFQYLASRDTRMALAVDTVRKLDRNRISRSDGDAFTHSGHGLDGLKRRTFECYLPLVYSESTRQRLFSAIASATGAFASEWTTSQAQAIASVLTLGPLSEYPKQELIASKWMPEAIRQQTVSGHLRKAHWDEIEEAIRFYEAEVLDLEVERSVGPQS